MKQLALAVALLLASCATTPAGDAKGIDLAKLRLALTNVETTVVLLHAAAQANGVSTPDADRIVAQVVDLTSALSRFANNADMIERIH